LLDCPHCGRHFVIPGEDGSTDIPEEEDHISEEEKARHAAAELDGQRVRHIVVIRRTAMRSRTYCIVAAGGCIFGGLKLLLMACTEAYQIGWHLRQSAFLVLVIAAVYGASHFMRRAAYWNTQSRPHPVGTCEKCGYDLRATTGNCPECGTPVPADHAPPDFSTLSGESPHLRNLERLK